MTDLENFTGHWILFLRNASLTFFLSKPDFGNIEKYPLRSKTDIWPRLSHFFVGNVPSRILTAVLLGIAFIYNNSWPQRNGFQDQQSFEKRRVSVIIKPQFQAAKWWTTFFFAQLGSIRCKHSISWQPCSQTQFWYASQLLLWFF